MNYIYIIQEGDTSAHKIGMTSNPRRRIYTLQTGNSAILTFIRVYAVRDDNTAKFLEKMLHYAYSESRIHLEWFILTDNDIVTIDSLVSSDILEDVTTDFGNENCVYVPAIPTHKDTSDTYLEEGKGRQGTRIDSNEVAILIGLFVGIWGSILCLEVWGIVVILSIMAYLLIKHMQYKSRSNH